MWKVRESKKIGVVTFWEVFKVMPGGETIFRGKWTDFKDAEYATICRRDEADHRPWWDTFDDEEVFEDDEIDDF